MVARITQGLSYSFPLLSALYFAYDAFFGRGAINLLSLCVAVASLLVAGVLYMTQGSLLHSGGGMTTGDKPHLSDQWIKTDGGNVTLSADEPDIDVDKLQEWLGDEDSKGAEKTSSVEESSKEALPDYSDLEESGPPPDDGETKASSIRIPKEGDGGLSASDDATAYDDDSDYEDYSSSDDEGERGFELHAGPPDESDGELHSANGHGDHGPTANGSGNEPPHSSGDAALPGDTFRGFALLEAPRNVARSEKFKVQVGFRPDRDLELTDSGAMEVRDVKPGETCHIVVVAEGFSCDRYEDDIPLAHKVGAEFECEAAAGFTEGRLTVQYWMRGVPIGTASRTVLIDQPQAFATALPRGGCLLGALPDADSQVDIYVWIDQRKDGSPHWTISAPGLLDKPLVRMVKELDYTREFAANLLSAMDKDGSRYVLAMNLLESKGQRLSKFVPPALFELLQRVYDQKKAAAPPGVEFERPSLLLISNEAYVPWELTRMTALDGSGDKSMLGLETDMGRWMPFDHISMPPSAQLDVGLFSAVSTADWSRAGGGELPEATAEWRDLQRDWRAAPIEAETSKIEELILQPRTPGHMIHFALHGSSDPRYNDQNLYLADDRALDPEALMGAYDCGETPFFSFVFLNACQVGSAGSSLGQVAGFPGVMVGAGVSGFIAPLWKVKDQVARQLAEDFYAGALKDNQRIGALLRQLRATAVQAQSATPLAYVYYGHPRLKVRDVRT